MAQLLNTLFSFLAPLWEMSLTAAFVAVVVILLRLVLKNRAPRQVICLLWLLVFARLLLPVSLESPVSLVPSALTEQTPVIETTPEISPSPVVTSPVTADPPVTVTQPAGTLPPPVLNDNPAPAVSAPVVQAPTVEEPAADTPFPWQAVIAGVWAAGFLAMLAYGILSSLLVQRSVRFAIRAQDGAWEEPSIRSPFILGLFRPKIYLPCGLTGEVRHFILCHERAHIRRRDYLVKPVCWLALALHWFNPAAWAAFLLMSRDIEVACDQSVLRQLGAEVKADYSATLLALATNGRFPAPTPLAFGEGDAKTRIKGVLNFKKPALWATIAAVVIAIVAAVCLLTDPVTSPGGEAYTTDDLYPGLYFETVQDEDTGCTRELAYRLVDGEYVLVAGYEPHIANNFDLIIHPDGEEEAVWASPKATRAIYEQYLVDACLEMNPNWVADCLTVLCSVANKKETLTVGVYYTDGGNLILRRAGQVQVVPLYAACSGSPLRHAAFDDLDGDGTDELVLLWDDVAQGESYTGDDLMICKWKDNRWTAYTPTLPVEGWAVQLVYEKMGADGVNIYYGDKLLGTIDSPDTYDDYVKIYPGALTITHGDITLTEGSSPVARFTVCLNGNAEPLFYLDVSLSCLPLSTLEVGSTPFVVTGMEVAEATIKNTEPAPADPYGTPTTPVVLQNSDGISVDLDGDGIKEILTTQSSTNSAGAAEYELLTVTGSAGASIYDSYDLPITFDRSGFTLTPHPEEGTVEVAMDGISGRIPVGTEAFQYASELVLYNRIRYDNFIWADGTLYLRSTAYIAYHDSDAPTGYITVGDLDLLYRVDCQSGDGAFTPTLVSIYPGCSDLTYWAADFVKMSNASYAECGMTLLALLPEEGLYLYEYKNSPDTKNYLRRGGYIAELDTYMDGWSFEFFPGDYNGDGRTETVLLYHKGYGTGCNMYGLMACWVDENGLQTVYHTPSDLFSPFNENNRFTYHSEDNTLTLAYAGQSLRVQLVDSYADLNWDILGDRAVVCSDQVGYTSNGNGTFTLFLAVGVTDGGPVIHYTPIQLAAAVTFDGRQFTTGSATLTADNSVILVEPEPADIPVLSAPLAAVLQNTATFLNGNTGNAIYLSEIARAIAPYETFDIVPDQYALVDLDGDGTQEMLLDLPIGDVSFYGYLILRQEGATVYGYTMAQRQFSDVKTNGVFWVSGGASDVGICKISFDKGTYTVDKFTYSETTTYPEVRYVVNHAEATEVEFEAALEEWHRMTPVTWVSLSDNLLPSGDPVSYFQGLLSPAADNCYAGALTSVFSTPAEMDLSQAFYNTGESTRLADLTAGEQAFLTEHRFTRTVPIQKRPAETLDAALREYFDITLDQISSDNWSDLWVYYPETDCYYSNHGDVNFLWPLTVTKVTTIQPAGLIEVYYEIDEMMAFDGRATHMVLTLRKAPTGDYIVVSNLPQEATPTPEPTPVPTPTADMFGLDQFHSALFDGARTLYFETHTSEQESLRAVLPTLQVLDRYEKDGQLHVICAAIYHSWYYDPVTNQLENTPGSEILPIRVILTPNSDGSYAYAGGVYPGVGDGYSAGVNRIFEDRPDTYAKFKEGTLTALSDYPTWQKMIQGYTKATGLTLKG